MKVIATRSPDGWWVASVPDVRGVHTQARSLAGVRPMAAEAIALVLDIDPAEVEVEVVVELGDELEGLVARSRTLLSEAIRVRDDAAATSRAAARALVRAGLSQKDAAEVLGVSFQRIHQLVREP